MLHRIIVWAIVIFLALYLITNPDGAANIIHGLIDMLRNAGNSLATFVQSA